jgi:hypothetical protein
VLCCAPCTLVVLAVVHLHPTNAYIHVYSNLIIS